MLRSKIAQSISKHLQKLRIRQEIKMKKLYLIAIFIYLLPLALFSWEGKGFKVIGHYSFTHGVKNSWIKEIPPSKESPFNKDGTCKKNLPKNVVCKSTADNAENVIKK